MRVQARFKRECMGKYKLEIFVQSCSNFQSCYHKRYLLHRQSFMSLAHNLNIDKHKIKLQIEEITKKLECTVSFGSLTLSPLEVSYVNQSLSDTFPLRSTLMNTPILAALSQKGISNVLGLQYVFN